MSTALATAPAPVESHDQEEPAAAPRLWTTSAWTIAGLFAVIAIFEVQGNRGLSVDDIGIFYRYAQNLASGHGWTYNIGESDPGGITSPLYVMLLAGLSKTGLTIPAAATGLWIAGITGAGTSLYGALRHTGHPVAGFTGGLLLVTSPWMVAVRGMESAVFIGLLGAALWFYVGQRYILCGVALALLVITRPDGEFFAFALAFVHLWRFRRIPWRTVFAAVTVLGAWAFYAAIFVGQIVPDTLQSKIYSSRVEQSGSLFFFTGLWFNPREGRFGIWAIVLAVFGGMGLVVWLIRLRHPDPVLSTLVVGTVLFLAFYGLVLNLAPYYIWYYVPLVFTACALAGLALESLTGALLSWAGRIVRVGYGCGDGGSHLGTGRSLHATRVATSTGRVHPGCDMGEGPLHARSDRASSEIGLIGWYSERPMIDYLGLFTPSLATKFFNHDWLYWVRRYQPDFYLVPRQDGWPWDQEVHEPTVVLVHLQDRVRGRDGRGLEARGARPRKLSGCASSGRGRCGSVPCMGGRSEPSDDDRTRHRSLTRAADGDRRRCQRRLVHRSPRAGTAGRGP